MKVFHRICKTLEKPSLYAKSEAAFWDDEYISKQMLQAHLNPDFEGASRKITFIEDSVAWIHGIAPHTNSPVLLDLGCGPGIYAEKFAQRGYQVTGVDFSKRSIAYARNSAMRQGLDITYLYQDYLQLDLGKKFDFATMIYCDYGALSTADRQTVLQRVWQHLKPGGKLLLDVFSMAKYNSFQEQQTWKVCPDGGFWREGEYIECMGCYRYSERVTLEQISIFTPEETAVYYLWNTYFSKETLVQELSHMGFKICEVFGDVAGSSYGEEHSTVAILVEK